MHYVLRLVQIVTCPPLMPLAAVLHDDGDVEALLAVAAGPILIGLTCVFVVSTALLHRRRAVVPTVAILANGQQPVGGSR